MGQEDAFGALLRGLRELAGLTQQELAERSGLSTKGISALERGERQRPYPHTLRALASALDLSDKDRAALFRSIRRGGSLADDLPRLRVVIAEDSLLVRAGIEALLRTEVGVEVVAVHSGYEALMTHINRDRPDVVVTDIRMPPTSTDEGIRAAAALRRTHPEIGVVVLSQFLDPTYLLRLVADGSSQRGYLLKERVSAPGQLVSAIQTVAAGGSFIDPVVVDSLVSAEVRNAGTALKRLTRRERETLAEVATGRSNAAIAATFSVSERAIEKHINAIFGKLDLLDDRDVNRRVKAVLLFLSQGSNTKSDAGTTDRGRA